VGIIDFILQLHNSEFLSQMISNLGIPVVVAIVFVETGLLLGFFLPGDSLLITAGVLTSSSAIGGRPLIDLTALMISTIVAAVVGDQCGYYLGHRSGVLVEKNAKPRVKKLLLEAKDFFAEYGAASIIYARFIPIMRTFVPFAAGLSKMPFRSFLKLNIFGGIGWVVSMVLIGHYLGKSSFADQLHKIILIVIVVSVLPVVFSVFKRYLKKKKISA
jgi:membrane-associated protein